MDSRMVGAYQSLFIRTAADGLVWEFVGTADGGCAVLCAGQVISKADGTSDSVDRLLGEFLRATSRSQRSFIDRITGVGEMTSSSTTTPPPPPPVPSTPSSGSFVAA